MKAESIEFDKYLFQHWQKPPLSDRVEERFLCAVTEIRGTREHFVVLCEISAASQHIQLVSHLRTLCRKVRGQRFARMLGAAIRDMDANGYEARHGDEIEQREFIKAMVIFSLPTMPSELEELVDACMEYAQASTDVTPLLERLRRDPDGLAFLCAARVVSLTTRQAAIWIKRSHVAFARKVQRIKRRLLS